MEITPLGDSALVVRVDENFEKEPEQTLRAVLETQRCLLAASIPGVVECAPGYNSVGVFFDPIRVADAGAPSEALIEWLSEKIEIALLQKIESRGRKLAPLRIEIPVCYDGEFAPDLDHVARTSKLSLDEVVRRHRAAEYRVHCVGFMPGFPYLGGLPRELATPRRATPRLQVPAGSVAIGGGQSGVYPVKSPGGWNLIGRTPLRLFDPQREPAALLAPGMQVKFRDITRAEFDRLVDGRRQ